MSSSVSETTIFNAVLRMLGHGDRLLSANDENPKAAQLREAYPLARDALIRAYQWNFAVKRTSLPAAADAPEHGFARRFLLPVDCLRLDRVFNPQRLTWKVEGRAVVTDIEAPLKVVYARRIANPQEFDALFLKLLTIDLAIEMSPLIGDKRTRRVDLRDERKDVAIEAKVVDANEGEEDEEADSPWVTARRSW